jgi:hypothetical protein
VTEWLLILFVSMNGHPDSITVSRYPTQDTCEQAGVAFKATVRRSKVFTCFEVAKVK